VTDHLCLCPFCCNPDAQKIEQAAQWRRLVLEQFKHLVLGHRVYIWFHDGRAGIFALVVPVLLAM